MITHSRFHFLSPFPKYCFLNNYLYGPFLWIRFNWEQTLGRYYLLITHYLILITSYFYLLLVIFIWYSLLVTFYLLLDTFCLFLITWYLWHDTFYPLLVTCNFLFVTHHFLLVTHNVFTCYFLLPVTFYCACGDNYQLHNIQSSCQRALFSTFGDTVTCQNSYLTVIY